MIVFPNLIHTYYKFKLLALMLELVVAAPRGFHHPMGSLRVPSKHYKPALKLRLSS
jgi:hypothetical protein